MFAAQRLEKIKEVLITEKIADITTLTSLLNVSDVTVRKDLDKLASDGFLVKTHGGAILVEDESNRISEFLNIQNYAAKENIARSAISLLEENDAIFVGSGSTCFLMHLFLKKMPDITVVTNNVSLATELFGTVKKIFLLSGEVRQVNGIIYNQSYKPSIGLEGLYVTKSFISADGFDLRAGITYNDILDYNFMKMIPTLGNQTCLMVDSSKFNKVDLYSLGEIKSIDCVICDDCTDSRYQQMLFDNNVKFVISYQ